MTYGCKPDAVTYNPALNSLYSSERWEEAEKLLTKMFSNSCALDEATFNTIVASLCQKGFLDRAIKVVGQMSEHGCTTDITCTAVLSRVCAKEGVLTMLS